MSAEEAVEVAADRCDGVREASREEVEKRLLLDRIDPSADDPIKDERHKRSVPILTNAADSSKAGTDPAAMRAEVADDAPVRPSLIEERLTRLERTCLFANSGHRISPLTLEVKQQGCQP